MRRPRYTGWQQTHELIVSSISGDIAFYTFDVEGTVEPGGSGNLVGGDFDDVIDNGDGTMTVEGVTGDPPGSGDTWVVDGSVLSFTFTDGSAAIFWDGDAVVPSDFPLPPPSGCAGDTDCPTGMVCEDGTCVDSAPGCTGDSDCPTGEVCDSGSCVPATQPECSGDSDCPSGMVCLDGECIEQDQPGGGINWALVALAGVGSFVVTKAVMERE